MLRKSLLFLVVAGLLLTACGGAAAPAAVFDVRFTCIDQPTGNAYQCHVVLTITHNPLSGTGSEYEISATSAADSQMKVKWDVPKVTRAPMSKELAHWEFKSGVTVVVTGGVGEKTEFSVTGTGYSITKQ